MKKQMTKKRQKVHVCTCLFCNKLISTENSDNLLSYNVHVYQAGVDT